MPYADASIVRERHETWADFMARLYASMDAAYIPTFLSDHRIHLMRGK